MGQSLNLYIGVPSGKMLNEMYMYAWRMGLKTTYYLRSLGATQIEKSTVDVNKRGIQPRWMKSRSASSEIEVRRPDEKEASVEEEDSADLELAEGSGTVKACSILDPDCDACQ